MSKTNKTYYSHWYCVNFFDIYNEHDLEGKESQDFKIVQGQN